MSAVFLETPKRLVEVTIDGTTVRVPEGATLLEACRGQGVDTPTLCYLENLTPVNVCRICVVEVTGSRTLVPACSRMAEAGMAVLWASSDLRELTEVADRILVLADGVIRMSIDRTSPDFTESALIEAMQRSAERPLARTDGSKER